MLMQTRSVKALPRRQNRSARRQPECLDQFRREGNFQLHFFARAERARLQLLHILRRVHQQDVLIGCRLRLEKIARLRDAVGDQTVMNAPVLFSREDVLADRQVIIVAVDELEREHWVLGIQHSAVGADRLHMIRGESDGLHFAFIASTGE